MPEIRFTNPKRTLPMILSTTATPTSFWRGLVLVGVTAFLAYAVPGAIAHAITLAAQSSSVAMPPPRKGEPSAVRSYTFSVYAERYHGHKMSNGKKYDHDLLTVASNDYALGSTLRLTVGNRQVIATVTDRMAKRFSGKRIDLSGGCWRFLSQGAKPGLLKGTATEVL